MTFLPDNWVLARVDDVVIMGPRNYLDDEVEVGFIPLNLLGTRYNDQPRFETRRWRDVKQGFTHLADGDVVLAKITPSFENGKAGVVRNLPNGAGAGSTEYFVCRPAKNGIEPDFLLAFFKTKAFKDEGKRLMGGAVGQQRVPKEFVASSQIPLPPISEQKKLVKKLRNTFRIADKCVSDAVILGQRADSFADAILDAAIRGALTTEWRRLHPETESGKALKTRVLMDTLGNSTISPANSRDVGGYSEPTESTLPTTWCWLAGSEIVSPDAGIVYGIIQPGPPQEDGVSYIRGMDIDQRRHLVRSACQDNSSYRSALPPFFFGRRRRLAWHNTGNQSGGSSPRTRWRAYHSGYFEVSSIAIHPERNTSRSLSARL